MQKILIMGLPGAGKTYFAERLKKYLETHATDPFDLKKAMHMEFPQRQFEPKVDWFNADEIRRKFNDWDFSREGRIRQSLRMAEFALRCSGDYVICDFIAPLPEQRHNFKADWTIWMDTIAAGRYEDTNQAFVAPNIYDFRITEQDAEKWVPFVAEHIIANKRRPTYDAKKPTAQMLGRYQPWHAGHRAVFEAALKKTGQVCIMIRDVQGWNDSNPFNLAQVHDFITRDLDPLYQGQYTIQTVPNIVDIVYGRDVGYTFTKVEVPEDIQQISATKIRSSMGLK